MRLVVACNGDTWDSIAYKYTGNEFNCDTIRETNAREFSDVIVFDGGEQIVIPDEFTSATTNIIKAPWE